MNRLPTLLPAIAFALIVCAVCCGNASAGVMTHEDSASSLTGVSVSETSDSDGSAEFVIGLSKSISDLMGSTSNPNGDLSVAPLCTTVVVGDDPVILWWSQHRRQFILSKLPADLLKVPIA